MRKLEGLVNLQERKFMVFKRVLRLGVELSEEEFKRDFPKLPRGCDEIEFHFFVERKPKKGTGKDAGYTKGKKKTMAKK